MDETYLSTALNSCLFKFAFEYFFHSRVQFSFEERSQRSHKLLKRFTTLARHAFPFSYLGVRTCELFLCFVPFVVFGSIVLTAPFLNCFLCFKSPVSFTGSYTEDEPTSSIDFNGVESLTII